MCVGRFVEPVGSVGKSVGRFVELVVSFGKSKNIFDLELDVLEEIFITFS